jgi:hypothetical protein
MFAKCLHAIIFVNKNLLEIEIFLMKKNYFETFVEMFEKRFHALIICNKNLLEIDFFNEKKLF